MIAMKALQLGLKQTPDEEVLQYAPAYRMRRSQEVLCVRRGERKGQAGEALRVAHDRQLYREFLARLPAHSAIAVEASGSYSWLVDEMERSGHRPKLCNPLEAKRRMGLINKTDKLDAKGLAILLCNGTLPEVWIPPSELRDQRELLLHWRVTTSCARGGSVWRTSPLGAWRTVAGTADALP
jgi:transposase